MKDWSELQDMLRRLESQIDHAVVKLTLEELHGGRRTYNLGRAEGTFAGLATLYRLMTGRGSAYVRSDSEIRLGYRDPETHELIDPQSRRPTPGNIRRLYERMEELSNE
jgi:hypothetical protein